MAEVRRLLLMIHNTEISWVEVDLERSAQFGGSLRMLAGAPLEGGLEAPSVDAGRRLAEAALACLPEGATNSIAIGMPSGWLEHFALTTPKLRGLDELSYLLREVTKRTSLPTDDVLFSHHSVAAETNDKKSEVSRLVVATREAPLIALIERFALAGITVSFVGSSCAALLANVPRSAALDEADAASPEIVFHLRRTGFAFVLRIGTTLLQFRAASIEMPEQQSELGIVIAEEVRRATIYFREKHRGRDVRQVRILGVPRGKEEGLIEAITRSSGMTVAIDPTEDSEAVGREDAIGLAREAAQARSTFDLIPLDQREARHRTRRMVPVAAAAIVGCLALIAFGIMMRQKTHEVETAVAETRASLDSFSTVHAQHGALVARLDAIERTRDALSSLSSTRIHLPKVIAALASSVPDNCHILRVHCSAAAAGSPRIQVVGTFVDAYWQLDSSLAQLMSKLGQRTGYAFHRVVEPDAAHSRELQTFALESTMETWNEPADP